MPQQRAEQNRHDNLEIELAIERYALASAHAVICRDADRPHAILSPVRRLEPAVAGILGWFAAGATIALPPFGSI